MDTKIHIYRKYLFMGGCILLTCMADVNVYADETNQVITCGWMSDLQKQFTDMGIELDPARVHGATVLAIVNTVDQHAVGLTESGREVLNKQREGFFFLPGFSLGMTNGLPCIEELTPESPAEKAGLLKGDVLTGIGTQTFHKISLPGFQQLLTAVNDHTVSIRYVRGDLTNITDVALTLLQQREVELAELLPNNIGYIKVNGLYAGSGRSLVTRIRAWSETNRDGIILDLRGAGGSDDAAVAQTAGLFCQSGQFLFAYRDHHHQDLQVYKAQENQIIDIPIMVLIDRRTTGAAETLAAALNGSARSSLLIGEHTAGDFNLRDSLIISSQIVYMTTRVLDTADGIRYNGQFSLEPSVAIDPKSLDTHDYEPPVDLLDRREKMDVEERDLATRRRVRGDGVLERAIDILIGLKSLNKKASTVSSPETL